MYIKRAMTASLKQSAEFFSALAILGPRQSGKTTLAKEVFKQHAYVNLEHPGVREFAQKDPEGFFAQYRNEYGLIIDEFQHVPELLSYIQIFIDEEKKRGYFVLTGSQNFLMNEKISQTLAGRVSIHTLLPLSIGELKQAKLLPKKPEEVIWQGSYPAIYAQNIPPALWYPGYIQTYLERDVRQLRQVENLGLFQTFIQMCAGRIGQVLNLTSLGNDTGVSDATVRRWITLLEASYIVFLLRPHHNNLNKRLIKSPKLYFYDTGLASFLLNIQEGAIDQHHLRGNLFENLMIVDFYKQAYNHAKVPHLYFWRDQAGHEIDLLADQGTTTRPIEIKAGRTISHSFFKNVSYWAKLAEVDSMHNVVLYAGNENQRRSLGQVVSWRDIDNLSLFS